jgi:hypothetical protein
VGRARPPLAATRHQVKAERLASGSTRPCSVHRLASTPCSDISRSACVYRPPRSCHTPAVGPLRSTFLIVFAACQGEPERDTLTFGDRRPEPRGGSRGASHSRGRPRRAGGGSVILLALFGATWLTACAPRYQTRAGLLARDPALAALAAEVFGQRAWRYGCP